jgi:hypothetical protein
MRVAWKDSSRELIIELAFVDQMWFLITLGRVAGIRGWRLFFLQLLCREVKHIPVGRWLRNR